MTVEEALIVCEILKSHGYGEYDLTNGDGKFEQQAIEEIERSLHDGD